MSEPKLSKYAAKKARQLEMAQKTFSAINLAVQITNGTAKPPRTQPPPKPKTPQPEPKMPHLQPERKTQRLQPDQKIKLPPMRQTARRFPLLISLSSGMTAAYTAALLWESTT